MTMTCLRASGALISLTSDSNILQRSTSKTLCPISLYLFVKEISWWEITLDLLKRMKCDSWHIVMFCKTVLRKLYLKQAVPKTVWTGKVRSPLTFPHLCHLFTFCTQLALRREVGHFSSSYVSFLDSLKLIQCWISTASGQFSIDNPIQSWHPSPPNRNHESDLKLIRLKEKLN